LRPVNIFVIGCPRWLLQALPDRPGRDLAPPPTAQARKTANGADRRPLRSGGAAAATRM